MSTGDRIKQWRMVQGCELCGERDETRDHLFFACPYSYTVWKGFASRLLGHGINPDWQWTINRLQHMGGKEIDTVLAKMLLQTSIYYVWKERNARRYHQAWTNTYQMRRLIDKVVGNKNCIAYKWDHKCGGLLQRWFQLKHIVPDLYFSYFSIENT